MKKIKTVILTLTVLLCAGMLAACGSSSDSSSGGSSASDTSGSGSTADSGKTLVVYFSATGNTKKVAEEIADERNAELYEIVPKEAYTNNDLDYSNDSSRVSREHADSNSRPEISGSVKNWSDYDTVFIGYPIWWGEAPNIVYTFVEGHDFGGKTVIPFCTSASSDIGSSGSNLEKAAGRGTWQDGKRFDSSFDKSEVKDWLNSLN